MPTEQIITNQSNRNNANRPVTALAVSGMSCGNCARHVTEAIQKVNGVRSATVSLDSHQASVRWDSGHEPNVSAVIQAIEAAGYDAEVIEGRSQDHAAHQLAGWQMNLSVGLAGTALLMLGEWILGLGLTP